MKKHNNNNNKIIKIKQANVQREKKVKTCNLMFYTNFKLKHVYPKKVKQQIQVTQCNLDDGPDLSKRYVI